QSSMQPHYSSRAILSIFYSFADNDSATTEIYTLSLHDALPIFSYNCVFVPEGKHFLCYNRASFFGWIAFLVWFPKLKLQKRPVRSEEHTSELQSRFDLVCRLLLEKKNIVPCTECDNQICTDLSI